MTDIRNNKFTDRLLEGPGRTLQSEIDFAGDIDAVRVELVAGREYVFTVRGADSGTGLTLGDPFVSILNDDLAYLSENDDADFSSNAKLIFTPSATGTYYLMVSGNHTGTYALSMDIRQSAAGDVSASTATSSTVAVNGHLTGGLGHAADEDWHRVNVVAGQTYTVRLQGEDSGLGTIEDPFVALYDARGQLVGLNDDAGESFDSELTFTAATSGPYYISARELDGFTGSYRLSVAQLATAPDLDDLDSTFLLSPASPFRSAMGAAGDTDYVLVYLVAGNNYRFSMSGGGSLDSFLKLYGGNGIVLAQNDDSGGTNNSAFFYNAEVTGFFLVEASSTGGTTGAYTLNLSFSAIQRTGTAAADILEGGQVADDLRGAAGDDALFGGDGADVLSGGADDDHLDGGDGSDRMVGATGDDVYIVDAAGDAVVEAAGEGRDAVRTALGAYTLGANVEALFYSGTGSFVGTGNGLANEIVGGRGADSLSGQGGDDLLDGGAGADTMIGGAGNDRYSVDSLADVVSESAGGGHDLVRSAISLTLANEVEDLLLLGGNGLSGTGNLLGNLLTGNAGANSLRGLGGDDVLDGGTGGDTMEGGTGNDRYIVDSAADQIVEDAANGGTDTVEASIDYSLAGTAVERLVLTGAAAINGIGNALANVLVGNAAANRLDGGPGADRMEGGAGADRYLVDHVGDTVVEASSAGVDLVTSSATFSLAGQSIENLTLSGASAINGTGNDLANSLLGNSAANVLTAGAGADLLDGGAGADTMTGSAGNDRYVVDNAGDRAVETSASGGVDSVESAVSFSLAGGYVEKLTLTGSATVNAIGNGLANVLIGNGAANLLNGGTGADTMTGNGGNDRYVVDNAGDRAVETSASGGVDVVESALSFSLAGQQLENLTLTGSAAINATGNGLANRLTGNSAANLLNGGANADTMTGGGGNDRYIVDNTGDRAVETSASGGVDLVESSVSFSLAGGYADHLTLTGTAAVNATGNGLANMLTGNGAANVLNGGTGADAMTGNGGNDRYVVDNAGDRVIEASGSGGIDLVESAVSFSLAGQYLENLTLTGTGAVNGTGNGLANVLAGNGAANRIAGGGGNDSLRGNGGADGFQFDTALGSGNVDRILDFSVADDTIFLSRSVFSAIGANGTLASTAFVNGTAAADGGDRILYDKATGNIFYDVDGSGGAGAMLFAHVTAGTELTHLDFSAYLPS